MFPTVKKRNRLELDTPPPLQYSTYPIPIKRCEAEDLKTLIEEYVPVEYRNFYAEMPTIESDSSEED